METRKSSEIFHVKKKQDNQRTAFVLKVQLNFIIIIIMISDRAEAEACYARAIGIGSA
jgi:hypothetical protein